jgi:CelD/BcsL family acetyltransferase involved in cellulose biosynthesis
VRARHLTFLGADRNVTELRGLICAPEDEADATRALVEQLAARAEDWDWFAWHGVRRDGAAHAFLSRSSSFEWRREVVDYGLALPDSWESFRSTRSRNVKESLRKCYNSLKRDGLRFDFHVAEAGVDLWRALDRFFELHTLRSRAPQLPDHADYFAPTPARGLLRDLARTPERLPGLRVFELKVADRVVASRLGFLLGDELYLYFSGFDPAMARYSVMTTTVAETIKWAIAQGVRFVNLSPGTDVSKTRWSPTTYVTCNGVLVSPTRRGPVIWRLMNRLARGGRIGGALAPLTQLVRRRG